MKALLLLLAFSLTLALTSCEDEDLGVDESLVEGDEFGERSLVDKDVEGDDNTGDLERRGNKGGEDDVDTEDLEQRGSEGEEDGDEEEEVDVERGLVPEPGKKKKRRYWHYCLRNNCRKRSYYRTWTVRYGWRRCRVRYLQVFCVRPGAPCRCYNLRRGRCVNGYRYHWIRMRCRGRTFRKRIRIYRCYCRYYVW